MATRIIYDQTLFATGNGDSAGWIQVNDVTQLVAGCTGFIYDADSGPIAIRVEVIDSPNSKLQLSVLQPSGSYAVNTLVAYTVASGTAVKIPQQAREDSGYVPPAGGAIAGLVAGGSTAGSGFVTFADSNGVTFGMSNNVVTASVQTAAAGGNLAVSAGFYSINSGTVLLRNSNGISFGMETNGEVTASYTVPAGSQYVFSNSNNVSFGIDGSTVTATASFSQTVQTQGLVNISGSTGTINFSNANGISFGGNNNTITASVVIPDQTVQTQNLVSIKGSTGNIFFDNANGLTFGGNNSTITASYTVPVVPAQTVQPVAASASNGSFQFSTLGFNQGGGVTFSTNVNGINAIVKTDYQSSNANYLTSQSNQAASGSNGSFTFQTLSLGQSNGATFYTTNGSVVLSYTVPTTVGQTTQPVAASGSNGSFLFSTLSHGNSNGLSFYTTNGSIVASYTVPNVPAQTVQPVAASGSNGSFLFSTLSHGNSNGFSFYTTNGSIVGSYTVPSIPGATVFSNSNNVSFGLNGSTITATATFAGGGAALSAGANSQNTGTVVFSNSNSVSFGLNAGTLTASFSTQPQTNQTVGVYAAGANTTGQSSSSSFDARSLSFAGQGAASVGMSNGSVLISVANAGGADGFNRIVAGTQTAATLGTVVFSNSNNVSFGMSNSSVVTASASFAQSTQPVAVSGSNGSFAFSTLTMGASNGLSFYTTNGSVVGSYTVPSTAGHISGIQVSGGTTNTNLSNLSFANSNNVSFTLNGSTLNASASYPAGASATGNLGAIAAGTQTATSGTQVFSNSNNVSFTMNGSSQIVASASFPAQTVQTQNLHNVTLSGNTAGVMAQISSGTLSLAGGNNITLSQNGNAVTISGPNTVAQTQFVLSNSNNVSFGTNGSTVTASATFPAQTVQPVAASGSNGSFQFSTLSFGQSNGATFYTTNNSVVVSYTVPTVPAHTGPTAIAGGTQTATSGTIVFSNSNNVSFSMNGSSQMVASASFNQTAQPVAASGSNGSFLFSTLSHGNSNGLSFYTTNGSIVGSYTVPNVPTQTVQPVAVSGSNGSFAFSTMTMGNLNGLSFYTSNGSLVGSYTVPTVTNSTAPGAFAVVGSTITNGTVVFSNSNGVSFGANGNTITVTVQPGAAANIAAFSAGTQQVTSGTVQFLNSNGVSFGMGSGTDAGKVTASISPAAATGIGAIAGGTQTATSGTIVFSNSNNVSFSMNGSSQLVASASFNQSAQPVAVSGSNGSFTFSTLTMGNSNGLTFYTTNGSVVGSYTVPSIPGATVFSNSNNVSFGLNGSTVTATATFAQSVQPVAFSGSNGSSTFSTLTFGNSNGLSHYLTNGSLVASYTVPTQTVQPVAASGSNGSFLFSTLSMGNSNGATFYTTNGSIVLSYTVPSIPGATVFSNSNNVSFGLNGSTVTATATFPAQTVQPVAASASNGSFNFSTLRFSEGGGVTWSTNANGINAVVKTDYQSSNANYLTSQSNQAFSASGGSSAFQTLVFSNSNNVTFSNSNGSIVASASFAQSAQPVAASGSNGSFAFSTLSFGASNGASFYTTNGSIVVSYSTPAHTGPSALAAGTQTATSGTVVFSNSNNVSFGMSNSSVVTASFGQSYLTAGTNITLSTNGSTVSVIGPTFANSNNVTFGVNGQTITASVMGGGGAGISAGTQSVNSGTVEFYNSNGISFGLSGSTRLTASFAQTELIGNQITLSSTGSTISIIGPTFSNSNGVTFGLNAGTITASFSGGGAGGAAMGISTAGNTAGNSGTVNSGTYVFEGSNNLTVSQITGGAGVRTLRLIAPMSQLTAGANITLSSDGSTISIIGAAGGAGGAAIQGSGTYTQNTGTVQFSNANGVTFGLSQNGVMTASVQAGAAAGVGAVGAGSQTQTSGTLVFVNSNSVTFGMSNSSQITASIPMSQLAAGTNVTLSSNGSTISVIGPTFANSNGVTFGVNGQTITASVNAGAGGAAIKGSGTYTQNTGTVEFANSNGVTFGLSQNGVMTASVNAGGGGVAAAAGTQTQTSGTLVFVNSNSITFGMSNSSQITASIPMSQLAAGTNITLSSNGSTISVIGPTFSNSNGVSFGINAGTITASVAGGGGAAVGISTAGNTQGTSGNFSNGTYIFEGSNGLSVSQLTAATPGVQTLRLVAPTHSGPTGVVVNASASTLTNGNLVFSNSNNITFGINGSTITASASAQSVQTLGLYAVGSTTGQSSSSTFDARTISFRGSHAYIGYSGGSIVVSADAYNNIAVPGATASTDATVVFSNSNGISFGLGGANNSQMTAALSQAIYASNNTTGQSSQSTHNASALTVVGDGGISVGWSNGSLRISGNQGNISQTGPNFADGNGNTVTSGTVVFSNSNGVSFGLNGSVMTASAAGGGGAYTAFTYQNRQLGASSNTTPGQNSVWLIPMRIAGAPVSASSILQMVSLTGTVTSNQTNTVGVTMDMMLYKNTVTSNLSQLDSIWSTRMGLTVWQSGTASVSYSISGLQNTSSSSAGSNLLTASVFGLRQLTFAVGSELGTGFYGYGFRVSTSSAGNSSVLRSFNVVIDNPMPVAMGFIGSATNQSIGYVDGGTYATTSTAMPASFVLSQIRQTNNAVPYVKLGAI